METKLRILKKYVTDNGNCPYDEWFDELKINFGPGYRVYFGLNGDSIVVLLVGGDKGTQKRDISKAKDFWEDFTRSKK